MKRNPFDLTGKNALVTGSSQGLGWGMAKGLAEAGAFVILVDINPKVVEKAEELREQGLQAEAVMCDLLDRKKRSELKQAVEKRLEGRLDIIVNNAGIQIRHPALEFPMEDWDKVIELNLTSVFDLAQWAGNLMVKLGKGKIINIASVNSVAAGINTVAYCSAKGAVMQMTKTMANELSSLGINVNCIAPGYMATPINTALVNDEARFAELSQRIPAKRWGQPEDMAGAAVYLASDASDYVCGIMLPVDGGYLSR
ncbi:glucose 1-dehydrogenase [Sphaerochaeta sp. S2]|uniref:glucose 1-dehydrogenase n=1 Tax=Sphaerochaeta sp. S2 TaxID=2798868 RepID=UPI0018E9A6EF|nr:glucose 1-dehydrogenase [Sphaerochaeta sp. S2]MBJ2355951.1 glucose 1-dehydrogenase [Sphaerochaeta sp. S2]MDY0244218.1 glucose 1-dehydrogenase [Sphaerochaeta sp.]